jgi:hypothetical protein
MKPKPKILHKTSNLLVRITQHSKETYKKKNATFASDKKPNYWTWSLI